MSMNQFGNNSNRTFSAAPEPKTGSSRRKIVAIMALIFGTLGAVFCGGLLWFASFPSVVKEASLPYDSTVVVHPNVPESIDKQSAPGYSMTKVTFGDGSGYGSPPGSSMRLFVYLPEGRHEPASLPCVFICGAGSTLLEGVRLSDDDNPEHTPYVAAGFVVVAYDLDGSNDTGSPEAKSYEAFKAAHAGLINAKIAIEYATRNFPQIDPKRLYSAGHSSAGTLSLLLAVHEPRLAGCIAYAPRSDVQKFQPAWLVRMLSSELKGLPDFLVKSSPKTHQARINCPVFLFHARDDSKIDIAETIQFAKRLRAAGKDVTFAEVPTGGHYDAMIESGIPKGIEWLKTK